jgi:hypothetical protein
VVQDTNRTLPRAFISAYVGLETSSHQDSFSGPTASSRTGLGMCSRGALLGSRCLPFPVFTWLIRGGEVMGPRAESMVAVLLTRSGWRNFSDQRSAWWTRLRTAGSKWVLKTPCSSNWRAGSDIDVLALHVRSCGGT